MGERQPIDARPPSASIRTSQRPTAHTPRGARPIVFALTRDRHSTPALVRALALARSCDAALHAIQVFPALPRMRLHVPRRCFVESIRTLERVVNTSRAAAAWISRVAGDGATVERFSVVEGEFSEQIALYCAGVGAQAIVIGTGEETSGSVVAALACNTGIPVLVGREAAGAAATIVAATDLEDGDYPVLNKAADIGRRLNASVLAVHNVNAIALGLSFERDWPILITRPASEQRAIAERLTVAARASNLQSQAVVRHEINAVAAIVGEASDCAADLIVVGSRTRRWLGRPLFGSVASQVVNRARCSVLVLPLQTPARACT